MHVKINIEGSGSMKKKGLFIILAIVLVCIIWGVYKAVLLYSFRGVDVTSLENGLQNAQELSINTDKNLANDKFHEMNLFISEDLKLTLNYDTSKVYEDENGIGVLWLVKSGFSKEINDVVNGKFGFSYEKLAEKNNIKSELDLLDYAKAHIGESKNIFWSKSHIQMDYLVNSWLSSRFVGQSVGDEIAVLNGDLSGIKSQGTNGFIQIYLLNDNAEYNIRLNKNVFSSEDVTNILSSVYFD